MEQIKHIIGYGMIAALTIISSHSKVNAQVPANELDSIHAFNSPSGTAWELQSRVLIEPFAQIPFFVYLIKLM